MSWDWRGNFKIIRTDAVNPFSIYMSNKCDSCLSKKEIAHIRSTALLVNLAQMGMILSVSRQNTNQINTKRKIKHKKLAGGQKQ